MPSDACPLAWYVCHTKPRQEALASQHLLAQGYETYLPELSRWVRHARGWQRSASALFPRYLFVRPAGPGQSISPVRSTAGVSRLVSFGQQLAQLPDQHLHALRQVVADAAAALPEQPFQAGMAVAFVSGPLKGLQGLVSNVADERVVVLLTLLGQQQRVATTPADLALA
jgi:transcriptional antiterminator RfaH